MRAVDPGRVILAAGPFCAVSLVDKGSDGADIAFVASVSGRLVPLLRSAEAGWEGVAVRKRDHTVWRQPFQS